MVRLIDFKPRFCHPLRTLRDSKVVRVEETTRTHPKGRALLAKAPSSEETLLVP